MRAICRQVGEEKSASCWKVLLDLKCLSVTYRLTFWNAKCNSSTYTARAADSSTTDVWWRRVQLQELDILVRSLPSRRVDNEKAKCEKWNFPSFSSSLSSRFTFSFSSHRVINLNIHSFWLSMSSLNAKFTWATTELCSLHYYCRARKLDMCAALLLALSSNSWWAFFVRSHAIWSRWMELNRGMRRDVFLFIFFIANCETISLLLVGVVFSSFSHPRAQLTMKS